MKAFFKIIILFAISTNLVFAELNFEAYRNSACGLNFIHNSAKITFRHNSPPGNWLPIQFLITSLPQKCYEIDKAFVWWTESFRESHPAAMITMVNPQNDTSYIPATKLGDDGIDKCWEEPGTRSYRVDVTKSIDGNGYYFIDLDHHPDETDGITFMIIYKDHRADYEGHLVIQDGLITKKGSQPETVTQILNGLDICETSTDAKALIIASDFQDTRFADTIKMQLNGEDHVFDKIFWNSEVVDTKVQKGQNLSEFKIYGDGDCYSWAMMGLYYRSDRCQDCPKTFPVFVEASATEICRGDTITITASGGTSYRWKSDPYGVYPDEPIITVAPIRKTFFTAISSDEDGCLEGESIIRIDVNENPQLTLPDQINQCDGFPVNLDLEVSGGEEPYEFFWAPDFDLDDPSLQKPWAFPKESIMFYVTVLDAKGCRSEDSVNVIVEEKPLIDTGPDQVFCRGNAVEIGDTAIGDNPPFSYSWSPKQGLSSANQAITLASPLDTTVYILEVTDYMGCKNLDTVVVNVFQSVEIDFADSISICIGDTILLDGNVIKGIEPFLFQWSPQESLSETNILSPLAFPFQNTMYFIEVSDDSGCVAFDSILVVVNEKPILSLEDSLTICFDGQLELNPVIENPVGIKVNWSPDVDIEDIHSLTPTVSPSESRYYFIEVTNQSNCMTRDSIFISVSPLIQTEIPDEIVICFGDTITVEVEVSGGQAPYEFEWTPESGLSSTDNQQTEVFPKNSTKYIIKITDSNQCIVFDSIFVNVNPEVDINIENSGGNEICKCDSLWLSLPSGFEKYNWSTGESSNEIKVTHGGSYFAELTDSLGCKHYSDTLEITLTNPTVEIAFSEENYTPSIGDTINLPIVIKSSTNLMECGFQEYSAVISLNKTVLFPIDGTPMGDYSSDRRVMEISGNYDFKSDTIHTLHFIGTLGNAVGTDIKFEKFLWNNCDLLPGLKGTDIEIADICRAGGDRLIFFTEADRIKIYPNPASEKVNIEIDTKTKAIMDIFLFDLLGNCLMSRKNVQINKGNTVYELSTHDFNNGNYLLHIKGFGTQFSSVLIIDK